MRILSVGSMKPESSTCRLRTIALSNIVDEIDVIDISNPSPKLLYRVLNRLFLYGISFNLPEICKENEHIVELIKKGKKYDIVWIDKGFTIFPETLKFIKQNSPNTILVNYSPDNMAERHNQSKEYLNCMKLYDYHITTKSFIIQDLYKLGAKRVIFTNQCYEDSFHYPRNVSQEDRERLGCDVGFVGAWEQERMESILYLSRHGIKVRVFGFKGWERCKNDNPNLIIEDHGLYNEDYAKSFKCFKICLCFLRKMNNDLHTTRTVEIPACGGFMLAERTYEHQKLFEEKKEAEYFSSNEELLQKCRYYLEHEDERLRIAENGYRRCIKSGYSNKATLRNILNQICNESTEE